MGFDIELFTGELPDKQLPETGERNNAVVFVNIGRIQGCDRYAASSLLSPERLAYSFSSCVEFIIVGFGLHPLRLPQSHPSFSCIPLLSRQCTISSTLSLPTSPRGTSPLALLRNFRPAWSFRAFKKPPPRTCSIQLLPLAFAFRREKI